MKAETDRVRLVPASPAHVGRVANGLREIDRLEVEARGHSAKQSLRLALRASVWAATVFIDDRPHAMLGVTPVSIIADRGCPWFLGSDAVLDHARSFLTVGPVVIERMHRSFARLENSVSRDNTKAIRLLRRWGFDLAEEPHIVGGVEFLRFWRQGNV